MLVAIVVFLCFGHCVQVISNLKYMRATILSRLGLVSYLVCISLVTFSFDFKSPTNGEEVSSSETAAIICEGTTNLALGKPARLSSQFGFAEASHGVDGIIEDTIPPNEVLTKLVHSGVNVEPNSWWEVDLESYSELDSLKIFNRIDCCRSRLRDFYIFSSSLPFPDEATLDDLLADDNVQVTPFPGVVDSVRVIELDQFGRYVRIQQNRELPLHFLEAEIYGCPAIEPPSPCQLVVDDVLVTQPVGCGFSNGIIEVAALGDSLEYSLDQGETYQSSNVFDNLFEGRYNVWVREVNSISCNYKTVVELQEPGFCPYVCRFPRLLSVGKEASQSSVLGEGKSPLGVDGDTAGFTPWIAPDFSQFANVVHTSPDDFQSWYEINLDSVFEIDELVIYPRNNCCPNHLSNFYMLISETPIPDDSLENLVVNPDIFSVHYPGQAPLGVGTSFNIPDGTMGQYVRVMSPDSNFLVISELSVLGCFPEDDFCVVNIDSIQSTDVSDCGLSDGTLSIFPLADTLEYSIDGGITFQDTNFFSGLDSGKYAIEIRRLERVDCFARDSVEIQGPAFPIILDINGSDPTSCAQADGSITIDAQGDSIEFSIDGGANFQSVGIFTGLTGGVYNVVVRSKGSQNCQSAQEVALSTDTGIAIDSLIVDNPTDCGLSDGRLEVLATGDSLQYSIDGGISYQDTNVFQGLASDSYFLAVRKDTSANCLLVVPVTVINPGAPNLDSIEVSDPTACISNDGLLEIFASGDSLEYSIDGGFSFQDSSVFDSLSLGNYLVVVREIDRNACADSDSVSLVAPNTTSIVSVEGTDPSDCSLADGTITIQAIGDSLSYSIDGGITFDSLNTFSNLMGGTYNIMIQEQNRAECLDMDSITLVSPVEPILDSIALLSPTDCDSVNGMITLFASGDSLEYSIDGGISFQDTNVFEQLPSGEYNVQVREVGSLTCLATDSLSLKSRNLPEITSILTANPTDCGLTDGAITINATGDSLSYSIDGGFTFQDSNYFGGLDSGFYQIEVATANSISCSALASTQLLSPLTPIIDTTTVSPPSDCGVSDAIVLVVASGDSLEYSIDGGSTFQVSNTLTGLASGNYDIVVREVGTFSCIAVQQISIDSLSLPVIDSVQFASPSSCRTDDGSISVFARGDSLEYAIGLDEGFTANSVFSGLAGGTYTVFIREVGSNTCLTQETVVLETPTPPAIDSVFTQNPSDCGLEDGRIQIFVSGEDLEFSIDNGATYVDSQIFEGLISAIYAIRVREAGSENCISSDTVELVAPTLPVITQLAAENPSDCDLIDGSISISAEGFQLEYSIDSGTTYFDSSNFFDLPSGIYYILVREKGFEKCVATGQVVLTGPTSPEILSLEVLDPQGCRFRDGSISIQAQGENLEYSANGGETFQFPSTFSNLERGMYNLVIRNPEFASCLTDTTVTLTDSIWCGQITCVEPDNVAQG